MMKKLIRIIFGFLLLFSGNQLWAQNARFLTEGVIEFDKSVNMYALIRKNIANSKNSFYQQAFDAYKKSQPQFKVLKSTLTFSNNKTLFKPAEAKEDQSRGFFNDEPSANQNNLIFTDFSSGISVSQKKVYEETFLLKDTARKITWKITDETREIAGYNCRRANAMIMDSIYVVAFYTDKITVPGGPESFSGLPGMILGVALPHENITWFATKVTDTAVPATAVSTPTKGKRVDLAGFRSILNNALKDWGDYAKSALKGFML